MAFITKNFLREKISSYWFLEKFASEIKEAQLSIFLSHSHRDKDLAEGFAKILGDCGVCIYLDWRDPTLPDVTNKETAERIKEKIKKLDLFILLATDNALSSRWCPWEIGIADGSKDYEFILIVPVVDDDDKEFKGNEYLQIYRRIEMDSFEKIFVMEPSFRKYGATFSENEITYKYQGELLEKFLKRKAGII